MDPQQLDEFANLAAEWRRYARGESTVFNAETMALATADVLDVLIAEVKQLTPRKLTPEEAHRLVLEQEFEDDYS